MIRRVARVNSSHPYLENDPSPSLVSHHLRISPWLRFRLLRWCCLTLPRLTHVGIPVAQASTSSGASSYSYDVEDNISSSCIAFRAASVSSASPWRRPEITTWMAAGASLPRRTPSSSLGKDCRPAQGTTHLWNGSSPTESHRVAGVFQTRLPAPPLLGAGGARTADSPGCSHRSVPRADYTSMELLLLQEKSQPMAPFHTPRLRNIEGQTSICTAQNPWLNVLDYPPDYGSLDQAGE